MALFWALAAGARKPRLRIADLQAASACVAIFFGLSLSKVVLPLLLLLNLLTAATMLVFASLAVWGVFLPDERRRATA